MFICVHRWPNIFLPAEETGANHVNSPPQFGRGGTPPVGVLFDGAFDSVADFLAIATLRGLQQKSEARVVALSVNRPDFHAAQFCDALKRAWGIAFSFPVGLAEGPPQETPAYGKLLAEPGADGNPLFKPALLKFTDSADPATVLRNALTASMPKNSIVFASGAASTVARLLAMRGSKPLIEESVRRLVLVGVNDSSENERLYREWPTEIAVCNFGDGIRYPGDKMQSDFPGGGTNALGEAYRAFGETEPGIGISAAALFAIRGAGDLFTIAEGRPQRVTIDPARRDAVVAAVMELAVPGARGMSSGGRRGRRG